MNDKRKMPKYDEKPMEVGGEKEQSDKSEILQAFSLYRDELDAKHDKHERLVKISRDITTESKRIIFLLHRCLGDNKEAVLKEAKTKLQEIQETLFKKIGAELVGQDAHQYTRAYYHGLQEYVEALTFYNYLMGEDLTSWTQLESQLTYLVEGVGVTSVRVLPQDYMLGVLDMTGELMRLCISALASGDRLTPFSILTFARRLSSEFSRLSSATTATYRPAQKLRTMRESVGKMEMVCYNVVVRGEEMPAERLLDTTIGSEGDGGD